MHGYSTRKAEEQDGRPKRHRLWLPFLEAVSTPSVDLVLCLPAPSLLFVLHKELYDCELRPEDLRSRFSVSLCVRQVALRPAPGAPGTRGTVCVRAGVPESAADPPWLQLSVAAHGSAFHSSHTRVALCDVTGGVSSTTTQYQFTFWLSDTCL